MTPFRRVRLTIAKRVIGDAWMDPAPDARPGKHVRDVPPNFAERYMAAQAEWALVTQQLAAYLESNPHRPAR